MISYFDTSALIPLIIDEPSTERCNRLWNESSRVVSVRTVYPEARAALARAQRMGQITSAQLDAAVAELEIVTAEIDQVEVNAQLARRAGELAQAHALRGYHAVHLAAAMAVAGLDFVFVTGDGALAAAAGKAGVAVSVTNR